MEPCSINYNITKSLWNKPISTGNPLMAMIQRICYVVAAVFAAAYETLRNSIFLIANQFIGTDLRAEAFKQYRFIVCLADKLGDDAPKSLRKLAAGIRDKTQINGDITISQEDQKTIRIKLKERNLTIADIERMSVAVT